MTKLKIVFMGTPDFAVESLKCINKSGFDIIGVITSPDKQAGRGLKIQQSPVKKYATEVKLTILQPENLKNTHFIDELKSLKANLFVVVAFRMLPKDVWNMPEFGTINLHASLLPNYRGAAPINWVLINGETVTGVTTFFIEEKIDTGKLILQEKVKINENDTAGKLHDKLMITGANLLVKTLHQIEQGNIQSTPQDEVLKQSKVLKPAPKIFKKECRINWQKPSKDIYNFIRGLSPYPCAWTKIISKEKELILKIFNSSINFENHNLEPGTIISDNINYIKIAVKDGFIEATDIQIEGRKRMKTAEFLKGFDIIDCKIIN